MAIFCPKKLTIAKPAGEMLRDAREAQGFDIAAIAKRTRIPAKYLKAIEASEFSKLPKSKAYRLAYIKEYAEALKLNAINIAAQCRKELNLDCDQTPLPKTFIKIWPLYSISMMVRNSIAILLVAGFFVYLSWQVKGVIEPPELVLFSPQEGQIINDRTIIVQGRTEQEVRLTINGQEIMANEEGHFETPVDLLKGVNTITVSAVKKHGKTTTLVRHIVARETPARGQKVGRN